MVKIPVSYRLDETATRKLDYLAKVFGMNKTVTLQIAIDWAYTKQVEWARQFGEYPENERAARGRVGEMEFTDKQMEFIFSDWPNWDEHIEWLATASRDEIAKWLDDCDDPV